VERRRAATVAGAAAATVLATVLGLGATFGLFGLTAPDSDGAGADHRRVGTVSQVQHLEAPGATPGSTSTTTARDD
jgi:hypothetical protein